MISSNSLVDDQSQTSGINMIRVVLANAGQNLQESGKKLQVAASKQMDALLGRETPEPEEVIPAQICSMSGCSVPRCSVPRVCCLCVEEDRCEYICKPPWIKACTMMMLAILSLITILILAAVGELSWEQITIPAIALAVLAVSLCIIGVYYFFSSLEFSDSCFEDGCC
jgi:hypothetical protein